MKLEKILVGIAGIGISSLYFSCNNPDVGCEGICGMNKEKYEKRRDSIEYYRKILPKDTLARKLILKMYEKEKRGRKLGMR